MIIDQSQFYQTWSLFQPVQAFSYAPSTVVITNVASITSEILSRSVSASALSRSVSAEASSRSIEAE